MILIRSRVRRALALVTALAITAAGCGGDDPAASPSDPQPIYATTSIWADITSQTLCSIQVDSIIPLGSDPHTWEPSIRTRGDLEAARLIVANGVDLEEGLLDLLATVEQNGTPVVHMGDFVDLLDSEEDHDEEGHDEEGHEEEGEHAGEDEHGHDGADPHLWLDPTRVADALPAIVDAAVATGGNKDELTACAESYAQELRDLDIELDSLLSAVPSERRLLVTNHDALGYFADRYGFDVVGTVIPATSTVAETNPADLAELADLIDELDIPAVFTDAESSDVDAVALADRLNGVAVVQLLTGSLTSGVTNGADYTSLLRHNAELIASALTP